MSQRSKTFLSDVAMSLTGCRNLAKHMVSGWKREHWPGPLCERGFGFMVTTRRPDHFWSRRGYKGERVHLPDSERVRKESQTGCFLRPDRQASHWKKLPYLVEGNSAIGYAIRWRRVTKVNILGKAVFRSWDGHNIHMGRESLGER